MEEAKASCSEKSADVDMVEARQAAEPPAPSLDNGNKSKEQDSHGRFYSKKNIYARLTRRCGKRLPELWEPEPKREDIKIVTQQYLARQNAERLASSVHNSAIKKEKREKTPTSSASTTDGPDSGASRSSNCAE